MVYRRLVTQSHMIHITCKYWCSAYAVWYKIHKWIYLYMHLLRGRFYGRVVRVNPYHTGRHTWIIKVKSFNMSNGPLGCNFRGCVDAYSCWTSTCCASCTNLDSGHAEALALALAPKSLSLSPLTFLVRFCFVEAVMLILLSMCASISETSTNSKRNQNTEHQALSSNQVPSDKLW